MGTTSREFIFSFIIPVFNRPHEVYELLTSIGNLNHLYDYEVVIVEDGSKEDCKTVISEFQNKINITYLYKENSGPGASRNFGMSRASGNYFLILDSDCILPPNYLIEIRKELLNDYVDCFGGPDDADSKFSTIQKAINYTMTATLTTGGIRGGRTQVNKYQPRSFNMGLSKDAFEASGGFGKIHPGEDPDLVIRLWKLGFSTRLFPTAKVYHKRRIDWQKFKTQVYKFGSVRPILNQWHPHTRSIVYWFPSIFSMGLVLSLVLIPLGWLLPFGVYILFFVALFIGCFLKTKNLKISFLTIPAALIQFFGYGAGFLRSSLLLTFKGGKAEELFPRLFFK